LLGKGSFGQVFLAHNKFSGEKVAVKQILKRKMSKEAKE